MIDTGKDYVVVCDAPGAKIDGLELKAGPLPGTLSIMLPLVETATTKGTRVRVERGATPAKRLTRVVAVGWDADIARAKGTLDSGILTISIPRQAPAERTDARQP